MSHIQIVREALLNFSKPDRRMHYFSLYSDDVVFHGYAGLRPGIAAVREYYGTFWLAFPDAQIVEDDAIEYGDRLALRYTVRGTHAGTIFAIEATGKLICFSGIAFLRFSQNKCVERWTAMDSLSLLNQLRGSAS